MRSIGATNDLAIMPARPPAMRLRAALGSDWIVASAELLLLLFDPLMIIIWYCVVFDETVWRRWVFFGVRLSRVNPKETEKDVIAAYLNYAYGRITLLYCNI
mmetsp:Transcript_21171/g.31624  ORF Transcript_21171/g.31624 Transcript_21171/m.31624 type:complete len:102 (-) Transcript_21171:61-366(-)